MENLDFFETIANHKKSKMKLSDYLIVLSFSVMLQVVWRLFHRLTMLTGRHCTVHIFELLKTPLIMTDMLNCERLMLIILRRNLKIMMIVNVWKDSAQTVRLAYHVCQTTFSWYRHSHNLLMIALLNMSTLEIKSVHWQIAKNQNQSFICWVREGALYAFTRCLHMSTKNSHYQQHLPKLHSQLLPIRLIKIHLKR